MDDATSALALGLGLGLGLQHFFERRGLGLGLGGAVQREYSSGYAYNFITPPHVTPNGPSALANAT